MPNMPLIVCYFTGHGQSCLLGDVYCCFISERELYMLSPICLSSVCLSSVTFVRLIQAVQIFGNISTALGTLALTSTENFTEIVPGEPLRRGSYTQEG